jgi:hypothetical protein
MMIAACKAFPRFVLRRIRNLIATDCECRQQFEETQ